jgi:hypothetical protein
MVDRERLLRANSSNGPHQCSRVCSGWKLTCCFKRLRALVVYEPVTPRMNST